MSQSPNPHVDTVRRAALPEVMFAPDIAASLLVTVEQAEAYAEDGRFGGCFYVAGRVAVLREQFLAALRARSIVEGVDRKEIAPDSNARRAP